MELAISGGGTVGHALAIRRQRGGLARQVCEAALEVREIGVGITPLPYAMGGHTSRTSPPDVINLRVDELIGDRRSRTSTPPSARLNRRLSDAYKKIAGFVADDLKPA